MIEGWKMRRLGLSTDGRTNRWEITPSCGHKPFSPPTTMFSTQHVECPKCQVSALADFNRQEFHKNY